MATIIWKCSRCTEETKDPFTWEYMTATTGTTRLTLCSGCKNWALTILLQKYPDEVVFLAQKCKLANQFVMKEKQDRA